MKDGLKAQRTDPRAEEINRSGNHKAEMNSNQGIFLDARQGN